MAKPNPILDVAKGVGIQELTHWFLNVPSVADATEQVSHTLFMVLEQVGGEALVQELINRLSGTKRSIAEAALRSYRERYHQKGDEADMATKKGKSVSQARIHKGRSLVDSIDNAVYRQTLKDWINSYPLSVQELIYESLSYYKLQALRNMIYDLIIIADEEGDSFDFLKEIGLKGSRRFKEVLEQDDISDQAKKSAMVQGWLAKDCPAVFRKIMKIKSSPEFDSKIDGDNFDNFLAQYHILGRDNAVALIKKVVAGKSAHDIARMANIRANLVTQVKQGLMRMRQKLKGQPVTKEAAFEVMDDINCIRMERGQEPIFPPPYAYIHAREYRDGFIDRMKQRGINYTGELKYHDRFRR